MSPYGDICHHTSTDFLSSGVCPSLLENEGRLWMEEGYDCNDDRRIERDAFELIMRIRFALKDLDDDGLLQGAELEDPLLFTR